MVSTKSHLRLASCLVLTNEGFLGRLCILSRLCPQLVPAVGRATELESRSLWIMHTAHRAIFTRSWPCVPIISILKFDVLDVYDIDFHFHYRLCTLYCRYMGHGITLASIGKKTRVLLGPMWRTKILYSTNCSVEHVS